jgi:S-adenosylmethionine/arginine decarboxylase-like enzyme
MIITKEKTISSYLTPKARIENNGLSGRGVFAIELIQKDELIAMRGGEVLSGEELFRLSEEARQFSLQIDEDLFISPREVESLSGAELMNHSCDPNAGIRGQVAFVAMRDIQPGEEITFDYAMAETRDQGFACNCGTAACRSRIEGSDHMLLDLRRKYGGYFSQWLDQKHASIVDDMAFLKQFEATGAWGLVTALDLHDCNPETIRSADKIREFTYKLCDQIKVNRFGEPVIVHFGQDEKVAGYSLVQLIETSLVSGHFANLTNRVYLDVFSCAFYSPSDAAEFAASFFEAKRYNIKTYLRH